MAAAPAPAPAAAGGRFRPAASGRDRRHARGSAAGRPRTGSGARPGDPSGQVLAEIQPRRGALRSRRGRARPGAVGAGQQPVPLADDLRGAVPVHGRADLARPERRRHQGRLPHDLPADRPQHRDRPRGPRHGHGPARGRSLGPGARPDPQAEQPRLRAREQHHAHRDDREAAGRRIRPGPPRRGAPGRRADPHGHQEAVLREGRGNRPDAAERHVQARRDRRRRPDQHADHPRDPDLPAGRAPAHRQPGHRHAAGRHRVANRRNHEEPRPQPRHQLERARQGRRRAAATRRT